MSLVMNTARSNHICAYSLTAYSNTDLQVDVKPTEFNWQTPIDTKDSELYT